MSAHPGTSSRLVKRRPQGLLFLLSVRINQLAVGDRYSLSLTLYLISLTLYLYFSPSFLPPYPRRLMPDDRRLLSPHPLPLTSHPSLQIPLDFSINIYFFPAYINGVHEDDLFYGNSFPLHHKFNREVNKSYETFIPAF